jgi:serine O-acetyltransferase
MKYSELLYLWRSDLYRYGGKVSFLFFLRTYLICFGFRYTFYMRQCKYLHSKSFLKLLFFISTIILRHYRIKFGIEIPWQTEIGPGFYIGHFGGIVVNAASKIGKNCNISQGVTLGQANRGNRMGAPIIGNNVYIGPGVKIIGRVVVGDNVAIGANCVVTKDFSDNSVIVGVPGKKISSLGSGDYVPFVDYEDIERNGSQS